jgi:hypothetical protein
MVLIEQVFKKLLVPNDAERIGRAREFGSYRYAKQGGRETALRHKKNWIDK